MKIWITLKIAAMALLAMVVAASAQSTMAKIQADGVFRVGMADSVPFQFKDAASGKWRGFNVDMANKMAEALGVKLEIVDATWATLIPGLEAKRWDVALVDMFATPQRAVKVMFSDPYFQTRQVVMAKKGGPSTWDDLNKSGNSIVVLAGTADEAVSKETFPNAETRPLVAEGLGATFLEVAAGRSTATLASEINIKLYLAENPSAPLQIIDGGRGIEAQGFSYAIRPGDMHLLNFLNTWVRSSEKTGLAGEMATKWIDNFKK